MDGGSIDGTRVVAALQRGWPLYSTMGSTRGSFWPAGCWPWALAKDVLVEQAEVGHDAKRHVGVDAGLELEQDVGEESLCPRRRMQPVCRRRQRDG